MADVLLNDLDLLPTSLWLPTAVLTVVSGEAGQSRVHEVAAAAVRRLPAFGSSGLAVLAELVTNGVISRDQVQGLFELDADLADFARQQENSEQTDLSVDSYFVDVLVERICDTNGEGAP